MRPEYISSEEYKWIKWIEEPDDKFGHSMIDDIDDRINSEYEAGSSDVMAEVTREVFGRGGFRIIQDEN